MSVIVRDDGFHADDYKGAALDLAQDLMPGDLPTDFQSVDLIRIAFPSSADGRGFTLARHLRARGYKGRLRAKGHVLADQYAMARRCGFDEVEISDDLAARQPAHQWTFRADWQDHDYRSRLKA
ncbi:DUF934 domain-containing protein [Defluviimonas aestuarii]|uniref:DUF934 domain-containing protein n=1 Tax=Albidovulum aestuarii TaxID=1130726 RepID=UPI00249B8C45|nr:DUF934 domain-containing protein [Defluviimonas aestuarii]MDI3334950.1 DUF934 domain-containing protein [Defluviimonas aestuarii]